MIAPGMRLEIGSVGVRDLAANRGTRLDGRTLCVDLAELRDLALEDRRFVDVEVHLARPGESVRIVHALDVVEPCWKAWPIPLATPASNALARSWPCFDTNRPRIPALPSTAARMRVSLAT